MPRFIALFAPALALVACSSAVVPPDLLDASASYQLRLDDGTVDWGPVPRGIDPEVAGLEARLDLSVGDDGTVHALLAPPFGYPYELTGRFEGSELTLTSESGARLGNASLRTLVLQAEVQEGVVRVAAGCDVSGSYDVVEGDVGYGGYLEATATLRPDDVAPEIRVFQNGLLPELAPWSTVTVSLSEPVPMDELLEALSVDVDYSMERLLVTEDDQVSSVSLVPNGWWPDAALHVELAAGIADLAGNEALGTTHELPRLASPSPTPGAIIDFESDETSDVVAWGSADDATELECASGVGCLVLRSDLYGAVGVHGRLEGEISTISFRIKARDAGDTEYAVGLIERMVEIEVGGADGGPVHRVSEFLSASLDSSVSTPSESEWIDFEVALPVPVMSPGIAINLTDPYEEGYYYGGVAFSSGNAYFGIDDIAGR